MTTLQEPFSKEQKEQLFQAIQSSNDLIQAVTKAQSAGLDVQNQLTQAEETRTRLLRIKQTYFPNE